jgi:integrase
VRLRLPDGRARDMGLGTYELLSLADARVKSVALRAEAKADRDPLAAREAAKLERKRGLTFREAAEECISEIRFKWKNAKHANQWNTSLAAYAYPVFGDVDVALIDRDAVLRALKPIWCTKRETASRVRARIEVVFDWCIENGRRATGNPALRTLFKTTLPKRSRRANPVRHHAALPFAQAPAFWLQLNAREGVAAKALAFAILTAARTGEVIGADWREIDLEAALWTVPGERMKAGREHRVPLSKPAVAILRALGPKAEGPVFAGSNGKPLSDMAMLTLLRRMDRADVTVHGFRSTFRDWAAERTAFPRDVAEAALAHAIGDATERAYRRGDALDKRAKLMAAWAGYLKTPAASGAVINLKARRKA